VALRGHRLGPAVAALVALCGCPGGAVVRSGNPGSHDPFTAALAEGDAAWAGRAEPSSLASAIAAYRKAAAARPADAEAALRLARAEGFRALAAATPAEERAAHEASSRAAERGLRARSPAFAEAIDAGQPAGEAAARVEAPDAELLYWLAVGQLGVARLTGHVAVLAVRPQVMPLLERAAALDERVDAGGPLRALGAWAALLPRAAGGGAERAAASFARAAELFPEEPWRRVEEARTLAVLRQDRASFDRLLGEVRDAPPAAERAPEQALARGRAAALLDKRSSLF
jgi:hypothetical protein